MLRGAQQSRRAAPGFSRASLSGSNSSLSDFDDEHEDQHSIGPSSPVQQAPESAAPWAVPNQNQPQDPTDPRPGRSLDIQQVDTISTLSSAHHPESTRGCHQDPGASRFRASVSKLIQLRRIGQAMPGSEPGVDPTKAASGSEYKDVVQDCKIDVITYGQRDASFEEFNTASFLRYLEEGKHKQRDAGHKARWINIHGMDWGVIRALALGFGLHPLSVEDVLHHKMNARSKIDYYTNHVFIQAVVLLKGPDHDDDDDGHSLSDIIGDKDKQNGAPKKPHPGPVRRIFSRSPARDDDTAVVEEGQSPYGQGASRSKPKRTPTALSPARKKGAANQALIEKLKGKERIKYSYTTLYMFLFRDGNLITIQEDVDSVYDEPIKTRLKSPETLLRSTSDASVLMQSMLDLIVDHAIEVVDAYQDKIWELERNTLIKPNTESVRILHMLSADITLHKRMFTPFKSLVFGLRRYDFDRCVALQASVSGTTDPATVQGYMSHQAKVYLADVLDHVQYVLASLEMFEAVTENLISYSFNILSYDMNEIMRRLTLATVIFFPLTFLTGYFGMNFTAMPSIEGSDLFFWKVALPSLVAIILFFVWGDILKMIRFFRKKGVSDRYHRRVNESI